MKIWLAIHTDYGVEKSVSHGDTKEEVEAYVENRAMFPEHYTVQQFALLPIKQKKVKEAKK